MISRRAVLGGLAAVPVAAHGFSLDVGPITFPRGETTQGGWAQGQAPKGWQVALDGAPLTTDPMGRFLVAFDRDAPPVAKFDRIGAGGTQAVLGLDISPRAWRLENINAPFARPPCRRANMPASAPKKSQGSTPPVTPMRHRMAGDKPSSGRSGADFGPFRLSTHLSRYARFLSHRQRCRDAHRHALSGPGRWGCGAGRVIALHAGGHLLMIDHGMGLVSAFLHSSELLVREGEGSARPSPSARWG
jgi:hypothetical protein